MRTDWKAKGKQPHFLQVQVGGGYHGTAEDGLGDLEVQSTNPNTQGGISSGKWIRVYSVPTNGIVVTDQVTMHATVDPNGDAEWSFAAEITTFNIECNGQDITEPQPAYLAEAGQNTALAFKWPDGFTVTNSQWSLGAATVTDPAHPNDPPDEVYVKDWVYSNTSASVVNHTPQDLQSTTIPKLFWVQGGAYTVKFTATLTGGNLNGVTVNLKGTINVNRPTFTVDVRPSTGVNIKVDQTGGAYLQLGTPNIAPEDATSGVMFDVPNKPNPNNRLRLVQILTNTIQWFTDENGIQHDWTPTSGLDALFAPPDDSPRMAAAATDKKMFVSDTIDTWLMYYPQYLKGGNEHIDWIFVPLSKVSWGWTGYAVRRGNTWVGTNTVSTANAPTDLSFANSAQVTTGVDSLIHPTWTRNALPGHYEPPVTIG